MELNRSQGDPKLRFGKTLTNVEDVDESMVGKEVTIRGGLHNARGQG